MELNYKEELVMREVSVRGSIIVLEGILIKVCTEGGFVG